MALTLSVFSLRWSWLISLAVGVALSYASTGLLFQQGPSKIGSLTPQAEQSQKVEQQAQIDQIAAKNILKLAVPKSAEEQVKAEPEPPPPPPGPDPNEWKLAGTFVGENSVALVTIEKESEFLFEGDVRHEWELVSILNDKVRFEQGEEMRELLLFDDEDSAENVSRQVAARPEPTPRPEPSNKGNDLVRGQTVRVELNRSEAEEVLKDPGILLKQALFKPYVVDGETKGFRLSRIRHESLLRKVGLKSNDVLTRINGQAIDGPAKLMEVYEGLKNSDTVTLDVIRGNRIDSVLVLVN